MNTIVVLLLLLSSIHSNVLLEDCLPFSIFPIVEPDWYKCPVLSNGVCFTYIYIYYIIKIYL